MRRLDINGEQTVTANEVEPEVLAEKEVVPNGNGGLRGTGVNRNVVAVAALRGKYRKFVQNLL